MLINIVYFWELWSWIDWLIFSKYNYVILFMYLYFRQFLHFFLKWTVLKRDAGSLVSLSDIYILFMFLQWQKILNKTFDVFKSAQIRLTESLSTMYCCSKYLLHNVFSELDHTVIIYHSKHY